MRQGLLRAAIALAAATAAGLAISACGSQTRTVTVSSAPHPSPESRRSTSSQTSTTGSSTTQSTTSTSSTTSTAAASTTQVSATTTRTSSAPAFVEPAKSGGAGLHAAVQTLEKQGYTPTEPSQFHPSQTLQVLVGARKGAAEGHEQRAFFFLNGSYLGTDTSKPSASIGVVSQGDTEVTLAYALYRPKDSLCCPSGGEAKVSFQLNDGKLVALDAIPPVHPARGAGRL